MDPKVIKKIIQGLNKEKIKYVLVGGSALVVHGIPRSTLDIDIYIVAKEKNIKKIFNMASCLGMRSEQEAILSISSQSKLISGQWLCFSYENQDILDVYLANEKEFEKVYVSSEIKKDEALSIRVASLDGLEKMKKKSGRPVDLADVEFIREAKKLQKGKH